MTGGKKNNCGINSTFYTLFEIELTMKTKRTDPHKIHESGRPGKQKAVDKAPGNRNEKKVETDSANEPMTLPEKYLRVKKSALPQAGKGLFTTKPIKKGTRIVEYKGKITTWKEVNHEEGSNPYIFYVKRDHVIDAKPFPKAKARFANDARGFRKIKGLVNNAKYVEEGLRVFIEAKKDIPPGSEILVDYGKEYWDIIKENTRLSSG